jgi:dihydroflavonol-4-reductase
MDFVNRSALTWEGGLNLVHVYEVGEVHALAVDRGQIGERYIVGGENLHLKEISALITEITGVKPIHGGAPRPIAKVFAALVEFSSVLTGREPPMTWAMAHENVQRYCYYDCSKTNHDFKIEPRDAQETTRDTVRWLLFLGKIKPSVAETIGESFPPDADW